MYLYGGVNKNKQNEWSTRTKLRHRSLISFNAVTYSVSCIIITACCIVIKIHCIILKSKSLKHTECTCCMICIKLLDYQKYTSLF